MFKLANMLRVLFGRKIPEEKVREILARLAKIEVGREFSLGDICVYRETRERLQVLRFFKTLARLGYLKPVKKKWRKEIDSLTRCISDLIVEIGSIERMPVPEIPKEEKVGIRRI